MKPPCSCTATSAKLPEARRDAIQKLHETETILKDKKILIVDDDIRNIFAMTSLLERYGMQIHLRRNRQGGAGEIAGRPGH